MRKQSGLDVQYMKHNYKVKLVQYMKHNFLEHLQLYLS
jgi:hypothetical protein